MATVLVTGTAGAVGSPVAAALKRAGHAVRGFDRHAGEHVTHVGDLTDAKAIDAAVEGVDVVIHLAACPDVADFVTELVPANVVGLHHVFDACRRFEVRKLAIASSIRAAGHWHGEGPMPTTLAEPRDDYALTKVWAEQMGEMYARQHAMNVIAVRIGWLPRHAQGAAQIRNSGGGANVYLSHDDAGRFFVAAVDGLMKGLDGFHVLYATSRPPDGKDRVDLEPSRRLLGYEPQDVFPQGLAFDFE